MPTEIQVNLEYAGNYYSDYIGFVVSVDDTEERQRILVYVPEIFGMGSRPIWAEPKGVYGGKGYGIQMLPQKDDVVWVSFRYGNARHPLWQHGFYAKDEKPTQFNDTKIKGLITPDGTKLIIDGKKITAENTNSYGIEVNESVILGKTDANKQPAALGGEVVSLMGELVDLIQQIIVVTPSGNSTLPLVAPTSPQWTAFKEKLDNLKSQSVQID